MAHTLDSERRGANEAEAVDLGSLHTFPKCPNSAVLQQYLGLWMSIVDEQGGDLPSRHLNTLLLKMLPDDVLEDVKRQKLLGGPLQGDRQLSENRCCQSRRPQGR